ncbi:alpha-galactosidase [Isoptericola sp. 4D.3]|uniref:Alpha-galactosidase n=1 Tax=Isoptericola peretonis TaxID=2918523 RepID=A0ABT0J517_9MICO|nr:alpha-galactosidase [Isoptericola sp. 4D.3]
MTVTPGRAVAADTTDHTPAVDAVVHLRADGVSVLVDVRGGELPTVVHWGDDLGPLTADDAAAVTLAATAPLANNGPDEPVRVALVPEPRTGWQGRPGIVGERDGQAWSPRFTTTVATLCGGRLGQGLTEGGAGALRVEAVDAVAELVLVLDVELTPDGVLRTRATLRNDGAGYRVHELAVVLPVPARAREVLDLTGRWGKERVPQRHDLTVGTHLREGRRGRTGADAATLLTVGVPGFGFGGGEVWGLHVGWSGNHRHWAERLPTGEQVLGGGELLLPGEVTLAPGEEYGTPWVYGVHGHGLDAQAARLHRMLRRRTGHPRGPRPVTLNVWEAVYFDHDLGRLTALADAAAELGVERYVLDDGWFRGRRDDTRGLGDWYVDEDVWPDGLDPIADHVHGLGMEFGLWFEPEMVNLDSDLARARPEWVMGAGGRTTVPSRHQHVLDLSNPEAAAYVLERMSALIGRYGVDYVKWDHNRDLVDPGSGTHGRPVVHAQTLAAYGVMAELRRRHPGLEIESCSSGGGRVDLGVAEHTQRVWVSDCTDPLERQQMQPWTAQLLPLEYLGAHVAADVSHQTRRAHSLAFRAATALFGHFGIEWDLTRSTPEQIADLRGWVELYKAERTLLHTGTLVRHDAADPDTQLVWGVVATDRSRALFQVVTLARPATAPPGRFTLRGLDPERRYRVTPLPLSRDAFGVWSVPPWFGLPSADGAVASDGVTPQPMPARPDDVPRGVVLTGRALAVSGLQAPEAAPESSLVLRVEAVD